MDLLIHLFVLIVIFGVLYWAVTLLPLPQPFKNMALVCLALMLVLILLGFVGWVPGYRIHYLR